MNKKEEKQKASHARTENDKVGTAKVKPRAKKGT